MLTNCAALMSYVYVFRSTNGVTFSADGTMMATYGLDKQRRAQIIIWDLQLLVIEKVGVSCMVNSCSLDAYSSFAPSMLSKRNSLTGGLIIARQLSDFPICRLRFLPYENYGLVSCGRENIRLWRIRKGHLPGRPVSLGSSALARGSEFIDIIFHDSPPDVAASKRKNYGNGIESAVSTEKTAEIETAKIKSGYAIFVTSKKGQLLRIDTAKEQVRIFEISTTGAVDFNLIVLRSFVHISFTKLKSQL